MRSAQRHLCALTSTGRTSTCYSREPTQIDCAYAATVDDKDALQRNPVDAFKATLDRTQLDDIQSGCPQCFSNLEVQTAATTRGCEIVNQGSNHGYTLHSGHGSVFAKHVVLWSHEGHC